MVKIYYLLLYPNAFCLTLPLKDSVVLLINLIQNNEIYLLVSLSNISNRMYVHCIEYQFKKNIDYIQYGVYCNIC